MEKSAKTNDLSSQEFKRIISFYEEEKTTSEIYDFGKFLVSEVVDRAHHFDSKATSIAGYGGTIIALLLSTSSLWRPTIAGWAVVVIFFGASLSLVAVGVAVSSMTPKTFDWFSDTEWVEKDYLEKPDLLKRYQVLAMHNVIHSHDKVLEAKNRSLRKSQWCLCVGIVLLLVALGNATWRSVFKRSSQSSSEREISILVSVPSAPSLSFAPIRLVES